MKMELIHGECLEVMAGLEDQSFDMILCDPPYATTACKWDSLINLEAMWVQLKRLIKPRGAIVLTASQPFTTALIASNYEMFKYCWVWEKPNGTNFISVNYQPFRVNEDVVVFSDGAITYTKDPTKSMPYYPQKTAGKPYKAVTGTAERRSTHRAGSDMSGHETINTGDRHPRNVIKFNPERGLHPTQKPVPMMEYFIKTYTKEGSTVLDFTMGSGSTGVACKSLDRNFFGIELDKEYFDVAEERINAFQKDFF